MGIYGMKETVKLLLGITGQDMVIRVQIFSHYFHIGSIKGRLESVGFKMFFAVLEIKGVGGQLPVFLFQFPGTDGRYQTAVYTA